MADTPNTIISGRLDAMPRPVVRTWDPTNGVQLTVPYVGTADAIREQFNKLIGRGGVDKLSETINGPSGTLRMTVVGYGGGSSLVTVGPGEDDPALYTWEIDPQDVLKPIETHPDFWDIDAFGKVAILKAARNGDTISFLTDAEQELYAYYAHQVLDYPVTDIFLRCSQVLTAFSNIKVEYENINRVVPLSSINPPEELLGVLSDLPYYDGGHGAWEWLKKGPQLRQVARSKFKLSYTWQGAEKWAKIYGGSWDPTVE